MLAAALGVAGCASPETTKTSPAAEPSTQASQITLSVTAPPSVVGNVVELTVASTGISIVKADGNTSGKTGHYHVFVDQQPVAAGTAIAKTHQIVHSAESKIKVFGLLPGRHDVRVVLGDGTHTRIAPSAEGKATVEVAGPSVRATIPAGITGGQTFNVDVQVQGLTLVKADGLASGKSGHLHVFIDRDPTPAGQPIPAGDTSIIHSASPQIPITGVAAGEHVLWIVAGDGTHSPLAPPVMDKLTFTVAAAAVAASPAASKGY